MTRCPVHSTRRGRLLRLPTVRAVAATAAVAAPAAAISAAFAPLWTPAAVLVAGAAGIAAHLHRNRDRVAVERKLVRALLDAGHDCTGDLDLPGLDAPVTARTMRGGVTRVEAGSQLDAVRALGYLLGRDRAFHLDLLRRTARGRLAEVWGRTALPVDKQYRALGLTAAADRAERELAEPERDLLTAFAAGVNAALDRHGPPFECRFLSYRPQPWTVRDSLVVALSLFHALSWNEPAKRAEAVLRRTLPAEIAEFFLPGGDGLPANLARHRAATATADGAGIVLGDRAVAGSNCWVRAGAGGPVLACDLHLPLTLPNLLYQVDLSWPGEWVRGLVATGLPVVLTGSNSRIAWGVTNLSADVLDLVPADGTPAGTAERVRVRGGEDATVPVSPVLATPLLGEPVAARWTGHDPRSLDLRFQRLATAHSVAEGIAVLDRAQGIALNVLITDDAGRMAHLATGLLPRRSSGSSHPDGHLAGADRPRVIDPPSGVLVSANDAALPEDRFRIGYDLDPGHRARRLRDLLATAEGPEAMLAMQHDDDAALYLPYRDLAVAALCGRTGEAAALLAAWDGRAAADSRAFGILVRLRDILAQRVLTPYLVACRAQDPAFTYPFRSLDRPLLAILRSGDPSLLPGGDLDHLLVSSVEQAAEEIAAAAKGRLPEWGRLNSVGLVHPLASLAPWAAAVLGIAPTPQSGALHTVRTCVPGFAAAGRAVLTPGAGGVAVFQLPGGQSGHPLRAAFDDRHGEWAGTGTTARRPVRAGCTFTLRPPGAAHPADAEPAAAGRRR